jgi:hypothetical protein
MGTSNRQQKREETTSMEPGPGGRDPRRVVLASYESYPEAQRAVDYLSDERFPVERVAIVAEDLRLVEQVTGRIGYGRAALQGAGLGAVIGFIIGLFISLFSLYVALLYVIYGAVIGLIVGLVGHALSGGQRDFSSVGGIQAGRYNVMADEEVADEASRLLARLGDSSASRQRGTTSERRPGAGEEATPPGRDVPFERRSTEEVSPREGPETREAPLSEEQPERRGAPPSEDLSRETLTPGEEQSQRPREERAPRSDEEPPRRSPPPPSS